MKKLTAVEQLENIIYADKEFSLSEAFKQAKELEKEQIKDALHYFGIENAQDYYNETFNQPES